MIEKYQIATLHVVPHEVACLVIAHAVPRLGLVGACRQVIDAECIGLGFSDFISQ